MCVYSLAGSRLPNLRVQVDAQRTPQTLAETLICFANNQQLFIAMFIRKQQMPPLKQLIVMEKNDLTT